MNSGGAARIGPGAFAGMLVLLAAACTPGCPGDLPPRPGEQRMCRSSLEPCAGRPVPFFKIEDMFVEPERIRPGGEVHRRIVYTYCPRVAGKVARGTVRTSVYLGRQRLATSSKTGFPIIPGTYIYDASVRMPADAAEGIYTLETQLDGIRDAAFTRQQVFKVAR